MFSAKTENEGSMEMDYHEFKEKSGWHVSLQEYEQIIEPVYLKGPSSVVGVEVSLFCQWLNENEFTIEQLYQIASIAEAYDAAVSEASELKKKVHDLEGELTVVSMHDQKIQARLDAVIEIVGDETVVNRMVDDIETEDIIDAWIRAKTVDSFSKEGRQ